MRECRLRQANSTESREGIASVRKHGMVDAVLHTRCNLKAGCLLASLSCVGVDMMKRGRGAHSDKYVSEVVKKERWNETDRSMVNSEGGHHACSAGEHV